MKKLTREDRRRRSQRRQLITYLLFLLLLLAWLLSYTVMTVEAEPGAAEAQETAVPAVYLGEPQDGRLPGDDTPATERCYLTEDEIEAAENEMIEAALLANATRLDDVTVTHYCTCSTCCGKSDGITASGLRATPGVTVAVDPSIIPLDVNTSATAARKLTITLTLKPDDDRQNIVVGVVAKSTLAPTNPVVTSLYVADQETIVEMVPQIPGQINLDGQEEEVAPVLKLIKNA